LQLNQRRKILFLPPVIFENKEASLPSPYETAIQELALAEPAVKKSIVLNSPALITLFFGGDLMTGRGIDQILPTPGDPRLHEPYVKDARDYVRLAREAGGHIPRQVDHRYIWGDALQEWQRFRPDAKIINLETAVTVSTDYWRSKDIHYKMHPANIPILSTAAIDCSTLANNHVLDWGYAGLQETLAFLEQAQVKKAGAGRTLREAQAPAILEIGPRRRVIVFAFGTGSSGIPAAWAAGRNRPGINLLPGLTGETVRWLGEQVSRVKQPGDIVVASIHWGSNWGYRIPANHIEFAHNLIERAAVDVIHGHSSHHVLGLEVYRGKLVIYGCGDLLNDYEGIPGYGEFRAELSLMYFPRLDPTTGNLVSMEMRPMRTRNFQIQHAGENDGRWLRDLLNREGNRFGTRAQLHDDLTLSLQWH
jgi:poly-gamma-glutamate capsule biosynthesis protein CapA/YwtB (metallophosphatase superfamily)